MKVELINYTRDPEKIVAAAARLCYSQVGVSEILEHMTEEKTVSFINKLMDLGHMSPTEHVTFTFAIEGISRACSHQLVRHRIASYSQQSQRYVKEKQFDYIIPPSIKKREEAKQEFIRHMEEVQKFYNKLLEMGVHQEDARYVLPNACETKIIVTMNVRSLYNFFKHRCCMRAQWEIRELAIEMLKLVRGVAPNLFKNAGPSCLIGECPEGNMSCGMSENVREFFKSL